VEINSDSTKTVIPAFPITAAKATMFLDYTSTCAKVSNFEKKSFLLLFSPLLNGVWFQRKHGSSETIRGSVVGLSVIKQTISALENYRFQHQHLYKDVPELQLGLRLDARIQRFESAAKHNEPKHVESTQVLKASGSSSGASHLRLVNHPIFLPLTRTDTYTKEELECCSLFCLTDFSGPKEVFVGL
jgi:hypothetical protein